MDNQRFYICYVSQQREQFQRFCEFLCFLLSAFYFESKDGSCTVREIFVIQIQLMAFCQRWMIYFFYLWMVLQEFNNLQSIFHMTFYTKRQCLQSLQKQERVKWRNGSSLISHQSSTDLHYISDVSACFAEYNTMVRWVWFCDSRELVILSPVEFAAINDDTTHYASVSTHELGCGMYDDICAMLQWTKQERCRKCAVYDQRNTVFMSYCRYRFQIQYIGVWIAQCLTIQKFGVWLDGFTEVLRIRRIYECYGDSLLF